MRTKFFMLSFEIYTVAKRIKRKNIRTRYRNLSSTNRTFLYNSAKNSNFSFFAGRSALFDFFFFPWARCPGRINTASIKDKTRAAVMITG